MSHIDTTNILNPLLPRTRSKGPTRDFNKNVRFLLDIVTDKPRVQMRLNRFENPTIVSVGRIEKWDDMTPLTQEELDAPAFIGSDITFSSLWVDGDKVDETHMSFTNHKGYFTVEEMVDMVVEFEETDRPKRVDAHHTYFEGIAKTKDGSYRIHWGS